MRERSFNDILNDKIKRGEQKETLSEPSLEYFKFSLQQPMPFFEDLKPAPPQVLKKKVSPPPAVKPPPPIIEKWVFKKDLPLEGQKAWEAFEKTLNQNFNGQTSRRLSMAAFRKFIKSVHPDLVRGSGQHNFSDYVKIKDEFIRFISI